MVRRHQGRGLAGIVLRCVFFGAIAVAVLLGGALAWDSLLPPTSTLMLGRLVTAKGYTRDYVRLEAIAPVAVAAVITSEDAQFCRNKGVDWDALHQVMAEADEDGPSRGASTITMQTAKNLFLWPGRSKIRKGIEIALALGLGKLWSKPHTIEVYLNVAEWGDGIFGIEAAARHYFHRHAADLDAREAALLATSLPNPILRDAAHPRPFQRQLAAILAARARNSAEWLDCLPRQRTRLERADRG